VKRLLSFAAAGLIAVPALAQVETPPPAGEARVNQLIVYGDDSCPPSSDEEIIVCARLPEEERYRIPRGMRDRPNDPASRSWTDRAIELSYLGRSGIGSCSPVGGGGFTGCHAELVRRAEAERRAAGGISWGRLIDEARRDRMRRIDREAEEIERAQSADD
jgi:hypothetical protein